ncbi:MAG: hypothetical protein PHR35_07520, partial [Kiritimatiellae bacterium]|nr:hypothetical protein [Kiritimatiellia bacterium]
IRVARAGYTGFHLDPGFGMFFKSVLLPELDHPQADENMGMLARIVKQARNFGLEVYLTPYSPEFRADHPVFRKHPELRGSALSARPHLYNLCSGQNKVRRFLEEQTARLFRHAPGLGGVFLITGGEAFLHCYTAPNSRPKNRTNCPRCSRLDPDRTVADLLSGIAAAVKKIAPDALVVGWTYNAFSWAKTPAATDHVAAFSSDCAYMGNFDTGGTFEREGVTSVSNDYSLAVVGPMPVYARESKVALRKGLKVLAKVESGCPREIHGVPSIPAMTRWARKFAAVIDSGATGTMFAWQFVGFTGSLSEELAGWMSWSPCPALDQLLPRLAAREFGENNAGKAMRAWRCFDQAMDAFPFSAWTSSFRQGPFSIGFAQPLILDVLSPGDLLPCFWMGNGNGGAKARPLFIGDLSWTHPFGVKACLKALVKTERAWGTGCAALESARADKADAAASARLDAHQALAHAILCMIRTAVHMVRFLDLRDRLFREPSDLKGVRRHLTAMRELAKRELDNAEDGLLCLPRNAQIGFDYVNVQVGFTEAMVRKKIEHTRRLIDWDLPYRMFLHGYGMSERDQWIRDDGRGFR